MHVYICCVQSTYVHFKYENVHQWPFKIILSWNMSKFQTFFQCGTLFLKNCLFLEDACVSWNNDDILHSQMRKKALQLHTICSSVPCHVTQSPCIWCSDSIRFPGSLNRTKALVPVGQRYNSSIITPKLQVCAAVSSIAKTRCDGDRPHHSHPIVYIPSGHGTDEQGF